MMKMQLFTPGPVPIPERVLSFPGQNPLSHRNSMFFELMERIQTSLSIFLKSEGPFVILPSSGTGALEALCSNFINNGDRVLSVSCGTFGNRFREIARIYGADIISLDIPHGSSAKPGDVNSLLSSNPDVKAILLTHNETSTGVVNPLSQIVQSLPEPCPLVLVDAVSSLGAIPCFPERWRIDGLASCSQKGLLTPPGLGLVWLSNRAWQYLSSCDQQKSFYFDLTMHRAYLDKKDPQNPFTPPVSLLEILDRSLLFILDYGQEEWFVSKERLSRSFLAGISAMGLDPFVKEVYARSPGVSSVLFPDGRAEHIQRSLEDMGIIVSGGQVDLKGHILRFAHYSDQHWPEVAMLLGCIYGGLLENGIEASPDYMLLAWNAWKEAK